LRSRPQSLNFIVVRQNLRTDFRLETPSLVLRPLVLGDSQRMFEMSQEDCARQWLPSQIYRDERHAATAIQYLMGQFSLDASPATNAFVFGVEEKVTGRLIGHVGLRLCLKSGNQRGRALSRRAFVSLFLRFDRRKGAEVLLPEFFLNVQLEKTINTGLIITDH
jgi:hypothetical protein